MKIVQLPVVVSFDEDVYIAKWPTIQGVFAQDETPEEAVKELINVIQMIKEYRKERGDLVL
jgi:predicted RNase H-like HicB family nuclease